MKKILTALFCAMFPVIVFAGSTPELIVDEAGKVLITNTTDALSAGGYVVVVVVSVILVGIIIRYVTMLGPKTTIQHRHVYYHRED
ncbi:MAG: hypothetical protein EOM06_13925 [Sphingobacteriia bacterium]|nr:hypothetical protein [Sphingobacteriia bacterium]